MLKIALTGGIGTGKSYLASLFKAISIPVFNADEEAKKLYDRPDVRELVKCHFGESVYRGETLDRAKLARLIFSDPANLTLINQIIHPLLMEIFDDWAKRQIAPVVMMESAIIFEADLAHFFDLTLVVHATDEKRIERLEKRNPEWTKAEIRQRMASQMNQESKMGKADMIIWNEVDGVGEIVYEKWESNAIKKLNAH